MTNQDSFVVYGKEDCDYCYRAKQLLDYEGVAYTYRDVETMDQHDLRNVIASLPPLKSGQKRTVPMVFINGFYVGGYTELKKYFYEEVPKEEG